MCNCDVDKFSTACVMKHTSVLNWLKTCLIASLKIANLSRPDGLERAIFSSCNNRQSFNQYILHAKQRDYFLNISLKINVFINAVTQRFSELFSVSNCGKIIRV